MLDLTSCPCAGITLDQLIQPAILIVLSEQPMHGYRVAQEIRDRLAEGTAQKPDISGIYRFLKEMEKRGLVASDWQMLQSGPPRKHYRLTPDGYRCLALWVQTLQRYQNRIHQLLHSAQQALQKLAQEQHLSSGKFSELPPVAEEIDG